MDEATERDADQESDADRAPARRLALGLMVASSLLTIALLVAAWMIARRLL